MRELVRVDGNVLGTLLSVAVWSRRCIVLAEFSRDGRSPGGDEAVIGELVCDLDHRRDLIIMF